MYADIHGVDDDRIRDEATSSQQKRGMGRERGVVVFFAHTVGFGFLCHRTMFTNKAGLREGLTGAVARRPYQIPK